MKQTTNEQVISFPASFALPSYIFARTNYNSLKEAWQSWQKFGNRTRSGDCKPLIIICLRTFLISRKWCGTKLRNKYSSDPLPKKVSEKKA